MHAIPVRNNVCLSYGVGPALSLGPTWWWMSVVWLVWKTCSQVNQQLEADQQQLEADIESKRTCLEQLMLPRDVALLHHCVLFRRLIFHCLFISVYWEVFYLHNGLWTYSSWMHPGFEFSSATLKGINRDKNSHVLLSYNLYTLTFIWYTHPTGSRSSINCP